MTRRIQKLSVKRPRKKLNEKQRPMPKLPRTRRARRNVLLRRRLRTHEDSRRPIAMRVARKMKPLEESAFDEPNKSLI